MENNSWLSFSHNLSLPLLAYTQQLTGERVCICTGFKAAVVAIVTDSSSWARALWFSSHHQGCSFYRNAWCSTTTEQLEIRAALFLGWGSRQQPVSSSFFLSSFPIVTSIAWILRTEAEGVKKSMYLFLPFHERAATAQGAAPAAHPCTPPHGISYLPHVQQTTLPPKIFINADSQLKWLQIKAESVIIERVLSWMTIKRHLIRGPAKTQF